MKVLRKVVIYLTVAILIVVAGLTISVFLFKDRIIQQFISEANKSLNTPVKIGKIDISAWSDFPNLAIEFTDVYIEDSQPGEYPLLTAKKISFYLNPVEAWKGNYSIRGLQINDSEANLKINAQGLNNFTIVKEGKETNPEKKSISFDLRNVKLIHTKIDYHDLSAHQHHIFQSDKLTVSIRVSDADYKIETSGDISVGQIGIGNLTLLKNKKFITDVAMDYNDAGKNISITRSSLKIRNSEFVITGNYSFKETNNIDLKAEGKNTDIQTVLSLLPENVTKSLKQYQSKGDTYFKLSLKGDISKTKDPFLSVSFGCTKTTVFHPDYKSRIEEANLEGSFASPSLTDFSHAELFLKNLTGKLNGRDFSANFSMEDFEQPYVSLDFKGSLDVNSIMNFYPIPNVHDVSGDINANVSFSGKLASLKKKATAQHVRADGSIEMHNINFASGKQNLHINDLNGTLQFNNNDLALSNVSGRYEKSDFLLNGFFKNVITFLLFDDQPIGIETDLKSSFIDLDQLMAIGLGESSGDNSGFGISRNLHLNFNCDVKAMNYKKFHPRNIKGDLLIKNQMAVSRNIHMNVMGGALSLNGIVDAKNPKAIDVVSSFKLDGLRVDSVFYVFENFYQDFIQDKHLKGQAYADINMEMILNEKLKLFSETLVSDIGFTIKSGELNNFEPMQKLNKYLDDESLSHLRFADLKNDIHIENKTIYIPQMDIRSNATTIQLSGTHTFDQHIDYRVAAPLINKKKIDPDEAFGAIEEDTKGQSRIFLKITGTTDDYKISLDKQAVKKKIASDLKKEVQELKDAFKTKGKKKKKELELEKDEYFDWDNN